MEKYNQIAAFGKELMAMQEMEKVIALIAKEAKKLVNADRCSIFIVDYDDEILWTKLSDGIGRIVIGLDTGIVGSTFGSKTAQIVNNPYEDERFLPSIDKKSGYKTRNMLTVPVFNSKQEVMGVFQLLNKSRFDFNEEDLEMLTFFANYVSGSLELVMMQES